MSRRPNAVTSLARVGLATPPVVRATAYDCDHDRHWPERLASSFVSKHHCASSAEHAANSDAAASQNMGIPDFVASIVGSLAWPLAIVGIVFMFRRSLAKLIPGIQRLKYKDVEVEFGRQLEEVKEELGPPPSPPVNLPAPELQRRLPVSVPSTDVRYFQTLAEISPRAAILEAWIEFEMAANRAVETLGLNREGRPLSMQRLFDVLRERELIGPPEVDALTRLRALRNQVVHGPEPDLSPSLVAEYASVLRRITRDIQGRLGEDRSADN